MTKQEEIQDLKRRAQNKSLPASAVAALNKMIADLEKEESSKEEPKKESKSEGSVGKKSKIKDWYLKEYSSDKLGKKLNDDSTFSDLLIAISKGNDVYAVLGVADSVVRERAFAKLSKIENKEAQWAYNTWLSNDEDSEGKKEDKKEPSPKYKVGDILWHDTKHKGEFKKVIIDAVTGFTGDGHRYDVEFVDDEDKRINKFAKSYDDLLSKTKPKSEDKKETKSEETEEERCQKIIRDAKAASKKARESAKKSAKKPEVTKAKERIERTYEIIENKIEKGSLTKAEVAKLIVETKEVLKMLEKALKSL